MMRLGRKASLLVAFSLLASATTAYAACAWVLWEDMTQLTQVEEDFYGPCTRIHHKAGLRPRARRRAGRVQEFFGPDRNKGREAPGSGCDDRQDHSRLPLRLPPRHR